LIPRPGSAKTRVIRVSWDANSAVGCILPRPGGSLHQAPVEVVAAELDRPRARLARNAASPRSRRASGSDDLPIRRARASSVGAPARWDTWLMLSRPLAVLTAVLVGLLAGAMVLIEVVLVPFWRGLPPAEFRAWFAARSSAIRSGLGGPPSNACRAARRCVGGPASIDTGEMHSLPPGCGPWL
jgi:hypothetical protein